MTFITHELPFIRAFGINEQAMVMYLGEAVEIGSQEIIFVGTCASVYPSAAKSPTNT